MAAEEVVKHGAEHGEADERVDDGVEDGAVVAFFGAGTEDAAAEGGAVDGAGGR